MNQRRHEDSPLAGIPAGTTTGGPGVEADASHLDTSAAPERPMKPFFILWSGQALSILGTNAVQFALIWWLTRETGSATVLALAAFIGLAPQVALGPLIGTLIDRWNRKRVMMVADAVVAVASLVLSLLFVSGIANPTHVFIALFVRALGGAFHGPAMLASTSLMVPARHLTRVQGFNQSLQGGVAIVSAPLGALLLGLLSMSSIMMVDVATALLAIGPLAFIRVPQPDRAASTGAGAMHAVWSEMADGFRYLRARTGHLALVVMSAVINMVLVPAFSLLPLLVTSDLGGNEMTLAWMSSSLGVGMIMGGVTLGVWGGFRKKIVTSLAGIAGVGLATLALAVVPGEPVFAALAAMLAIGVMLPVANGPVLAILQATIAPEYQGRVFTLMGSVAGAMAPVGLLVAAPVAEWLGVRVWYGVGGVVCITMALLALTVPAILRIEDDGYRDVATGAGTPVAAGHG